MSGSIAEALQSNLNDWTDWDIAAGYLGNQIGVLQIDLANELDTKHIFWTDNPIGNTLHDMLNQLAEIGRLEKRDEPDIQYRWNKNFSIDDSNQT